MLALDTNFLIRFLVEDDPRQTERARKLVAEATRDGAACYVSEIVLCETVWVLRSAYRQSRGEILALLRQLIRSRQLLLATTDRIARAIDAYGRGRGDFADYLIREHARQAGC